MTDTVWYHLLVESRKAKLEWQRPAVGVGGIQKILVKGSKLEFWRSNVLHSDCCQQYCVINFNVV